VSRPGPASTNRPQPLPPDSLSPSLGAQHWKPSTPGSCISGASKPENGSLSSTHHWGPSLEGPMPGLEEGHGVPRMGKPWPVFYIVVPTSWGLLLLTVSPLWNPHQTGGPGGARLPPHIPGSVFRQGKSPRHRDRLRSGSSAWGISTTAPTF
jgi:hypothetical protein